MSEIGGMMWTFGPFGDKMGLIRALEEGGSVLAGCWNQPLPVLAAMVFSQILSPFATYNFLVLLSFPLTLFFAYRFFRRFFDSWISFSLSLVFTFSPYHILKIYNHVVLSQIWVFPLCFSALLDSAEVSFCRDAPSGRLYGTILKLAGLLALTTLVSNYYGYFMLVIVGLFFLTRSFQRRNFSPLISHLPPLILCYLLLTIPFFFPYIKPVYLEGGLPERGISDFVTFTARPWYFVTPSVYHPVLGRFAESVHKWFERTGYFLFDDFFAQEHSGIFLGWTNLVLAAYATLATLRRAAAGGTLRVGGGNPKGWGMRRLVYTYFWLALSLAILSAPPFFTIVGLKIYLPSYLLMKGFPMFRTLARLGVPILLCVLVLAGYGLDIIKKRFCGGSLLSLSPVACSLLLSACYLLLALFEFYNPPTIVDVPERGSVEYNQLMEITNSKNQ